MAHYRGDTWKLPLDNTGFCHNKNIDKITPTDMVYPSTNVYMNEGGIRKRPGTGRVDDTDAVSMGATKVTGLFDFTMADGTQFIMRATADGKLWKDVVLANIIKTAWGTDVKVQFTQWEDEIIICNGKSIPTVWNGVAAGTTDLTVGVKAQGLITMTGIATADETFTIDTELYTWKAARTTDYEVEIGTTSAEAAANIVTALNADSVVVTGEVTDTTKVTVTTVDYGADNNSMVFIESSTNMAMDGSGTMGATTAGVDDQMPSDWSGTNYPKWMIKHGRGNSIRNWAIGCVLNPHTVYVTASGLPKDFSDLSVLTFDIDSGDGKGLTGGTSFGDRLILFSNTKSFMMEDSDTNTDNWGWTESQWSGGLAHQRVLVRTPNDLVCMTETGEIYSVATAEQYGDYKAASLSRPSYIHEWIKTYINLSKIDDFHGVYDPTIRAVIYFVVREGQTEVDTALIYFVDRDPAHAWMVLGNENFESGYSAYSSGLVRHSVGVQKIYTGSYAGRIWKLGEINRNDNDAAFVAKCILPTTAFDAERDSKRYDRIKTVAIAEGGCDATLAWAVDGQDISEEELNFASSGEFLGSFILGTSVLGGKNILEMSVKVGCIGKRIELELTNNVANEDFFISQFLIDFITIGRTA